MGRRAAGAKRIAAIRSTGGCLLALVGAGALAASVAGQALYECVDASGAVRFQDRPCDPAQASRELRSTPKREPEPPAVAVVPIPPRPRIRVPEGEPFALDPAAVDTEPWSEALARAGQLPPIRAGGGQLSLLRVFLEDAERQEWLQLTSTKLRTLDQESGGGRFQQLPSGSFVVVEHIASNRRRDGRDPVTIRGLEHAGTELWVEVPEPGQVGAVGDVVLARAARTGGLQVRVAPAPGSGAPRPERIVVGPVAVGGPYGRSFPCDPEGACATGPLAPGAYRVLLPDYDVVKSRYEVEVAAGRVTRLGLRALSRRELDRVAEDSLPAAPDW